jgi:Uma2 family endonuclease
MVPGTATVIPSPVIYPESDGKPMAENTEQLRWIVVLFINLAAMFRDAADVFIGSDLFWYPVEGRPEIRTAPDVLVVFGRPRGKRGAYRQWEEAGIPLTVVFEVLSPGNTTEEMIEKYAFYEEYGVEEYYIYNPDTNRLQVYVRRGEIFRRQWFSNEFVSPRLGIRFDLTGPEMAVFRPDGQRFLTPEELEATRVQSEQRATTAEQRARRVAELSRTARLGQASPEEIAELEQLERELSS